MIAYVSEPPEADGTEKLEIPVPPDPADLAAELITNCVALVTDNTVAPAGIPVPLTVIPGANPVVLATVTVGLPKVVANPVKDTLLSRRLYVATPGAATM